MNGIMYYINKDGEYKYNENSILKNVQVDINTVYKNTSLLEYDFDTKLGQYYKENETGYYTIIENGTTPVLLNRYNDTANSYFNHEYIMNVEQENIEYYTYINNISVYSKTTTNSNNNYIEDFYLMYDGNTIYRDNWQLVIIEHPNIGGSKISDIIKLYKSSDGTELQWLLNDNYNYNSDKYIYKYTDQNINYTLIDDIRNYIGKTVYVKVLNTNSDNPNDLYYGITYDVNRMWVESLPFYIIQNNEYKEITNVEYLFDYPGDVYIKINESYILTNIHQKDIEEFYIDDSIKFINNVPEVQMFVDHSGIFFTLHFDKENKIWTRRNIERFVRNIETTNIIDTTGYSLYDVNTKKIYSMYDINVIHNIIDNNIHLMKDFCGIRNITDYPFEPDGLWYLYDKQNHKFVTLVYIEGQLIENIKWYYTINGQEYEYTGKIKTDNISGDYVYLNLTELGEEPIKVKLHKTPKIEAKQRSYIISDKYTFKYVKSDDKFLVNRMDYIPSNGKNHFETDDIIISEISTKMNKYADFKTEFKLNYGTKWIYEPISLRMKNSAIVESQSETGIMSIGDSNIKYEKGYYNLICNYSIDGNTENIYKKSAKILVK